MRTIWTVSVVSTVFALICCASAAASPHRNDKVYRAATDARAGALELLKEIVDIDSGTGDVAGGAKVEALLAARLTALGAEVRTEPAEAAELPDNLLAVFHGTGKGKILIIAHIDTVFGPGTAAGRPFSIDRERGFGGCFSACRRRHTLQHPCSQSRGAPKHHSGPRGGEPQCAFPQAGGLRRRAVRGRSRPPRRPGAGSPGHGAARSGLPAAHRK